MNIGARYTFAVVVTIAAIAATLALPELLQPMRLFFLWAAVLITSVVAGTGPGLLATALALAGAGYFLFGPQHSIQIKDPLDLVRFAMFAIFAGGISAAVGMRRTLAERLRASEQRYRKAAEEAESANRAKDEFLATLSHELRTPLTAITGWAHMLAIGIPDPETNRLAVETIVRSARMQAELIDDLLDVSSAVAGSLQLDLSPVDLVTIVREVLHAAKPAADAKGVRLCESPSSAAVVVRGDQRRLRQIVWNLVSNGVKFTDAGGEVRASVTGNATTACVEVRDTGRGIAPSFLPHVWERFRQADSSSSREYSGLGLGLSVVRHLTELHGGTVAAESDGRGKGATFRVEIPL